MLTFAGRVAIVTGAGGGIGLACARMLLENGILVVATDLKPCPAELADAGDTVSFIQGDITEQETVTACVDRAEGLGGIDYIITSAGVLLSGDGSMLDNDPELMDKVFDINTRSAIRLVRASIGSLRRSPTPAIVHVASVVGVRNMENIFDGGPADAYQLSKAAIVSASRSLAVQLARDGIRSNTVCPGSVVSPMTAEIYSDPERVKAMEARTPLGRIGRPADMAGACLYLLSDQASFVTGIDLVVDGGQMAKL